MNMVRLSPSLLRGLQHTTTHRRPHGWGFRHALVVAAVRDALQRSLSMTPTMQRDVLDMSSSGIAKGVLRVQRSIAGRRALHYTFDGADDSRRILHFHGGGYCIGEPESNDGYLSRLCKLSGVPVLSLDYRLAPEHRFPAAVLDATSAVHALIDEGIAPHRLALCGDSAGGGLCLSTLVTLRDQSGVTLAGASLGSPWVDLRGVGVNEGRNGKNDYLIVDIITQWRDRYLGDASPDDPLASPTLADHRGLPPLQFIIGTKERLADDIEACAAKCEQAGVETCFVRGEHAVHTWYRMTRGELPGPRDTIEHIAAFLARCTAQA